MRLQVRSLQNAPPGFFTWGKRGEGCLPSIPGQQAAQGRGSPQGSLLPSFTALDSQRDLGSLPALTTMMAPSSFTQRPC